MDLAGTKMIFHKEMCHIFIKLKKLRSISLEIQFVHSVSAFFGICVYNENCSDDISLQDFYVGGSYGSTVKLDGLET